jgi:signal transduction histidine kinase/DNA-binding response OmpR family regulator
MTDTTRILYIDDYPLDRGLVRAALSAADNAYELIEAASWEAFIDLLERDSYDLILSDFNILGFEGLKVIDAVHARLPGTPVIIVTGTGTEEIAVESIKRGAADYVIKSPQHIQRLPHTIQSALQKQQARVARAEAEQRLRESESRYALATQAAKVGIWDHKLDSGTFYVDPNFLARLGFGKTELTLDDWLNLPVESARLGFSKAFVRFVQGDKLEFADEVQMQAPGAPEHWVLVRGSKIAYGEQPVDRVIGTLVDISDRKHAELATQRQSENIEALRNIDQTVLTTGMPSETSAGIISWIGRLTEACYVSAWDFDFGSHEAVCVAASKADSKRFENEIAVPINAWPLLDSLNEGKITRLDAKDYVDAHPILKDLESSEAQAADIVPLIAGGELLGVLIIGLEQPAPMSAQLAETVSQTANSLAISFRQFRLFSQVQERADRLTALQESITALNRAVSLQAKFKTIQRQVLDIHPGFYPPFFAIVPPSGDVLSPYILDEESEELKQFDSKFGMELRNFRLPLDQLPGGQVDMLQSGYPVILSELPTALVTELPDAVVSWLSELPGLNSMLAIPFNLEERLLGIMFVAGPRSLNREEVQLLTALANQAAIAFQNARLFELVRAGRHRLQNLSKQLLDVQEAERRHIARELHDQIGQALTALKINLQALDRFLPPGEADIYMNESIEIAEKTLQQVRNLSLDLRPSLLDDLGLVPAVRWYLDRQGQRTGIKIKFVASVGEERLPTQIETTCFRVIQEALTNVVRHAQATRVRVELSQAGNILDLLMRDDGVGFDVQAAMEDAGKGQSLGILGLQERVYMIGGRVQFESVLNHGTEIRAQLPIDINARVERRNSRR